MATNKVKFPFGSIKLVSTMPDIEKCKTKLKLDEQIVIAARMSTTEELKSFTQDKELINYLMRNFHTSPFEMVQFCFRVKCPIYIARQWMRHRTASYNEFSGRYSQFKGDIYIPQIENYNGGKKDEELQKLINESCEYDFDVYNKLIEKGVPKELARASIPVAQKTKFMFSMNLHNLFHLIELRIDEHAQYEFREYATAMLNIIKELCPISSAAFISYRLSKPKLNNKELTLFMSIFTDEEKKDISQRISALQPKNFSKGELMDFKKKF